MVKVLKNPKPNLYCWMSQIQILNQPVSHIVTDPICLARVGAGFFHYVHSDLKFSHVRNEDMLRMWKTVIYRRKPLTLQSFPSPLLSSEYNHWIRKQLVLCSTFVSLEGKALMSLKSRPLSCDELSFALQQIFSVPQGAGKQCLAITQPPPPAELCASQ